ncbi:MAG: GFA family protein [bacterium]
MSNAGQCLCGATKFVATPKSLDVNVCHCAMCRRQNAGPLMTINCGDSLKFDDETYVGRFDSSDYGERLFCKSCGSILAWCLKDGTGNYVSVEVFDDLDHPTLRQEIYYDKKPGYYSFAEDTKKMTEAEVIAAFTATAEKQEGG